MSEFVCSRCDEQATRKQGHQWLCAKHYRIGQMLAGAKRNGKTVPPRELVEAMCSNGMACQDCGKEMNWLAVDGQSTVASLQHYRDGTFGLVCRSCNTRHHFTPGDAYRDMPKDHKFCPGCETIKPLTEFAKDNARSGQMKVKSKCKPCSNAAVTKWKESNRERYNEYQRRYRAAS